MIVVMVKVVVIMNDDDNNDDLTTTTTMMMMVMLSGDGYGGSGDERPPRMPTGANDKKTAVGAGESSDPAGLRLKKIETCARLGLVAQKGGYKSPLRADYPPLPPVLIPCLPVVVDYYHLRRHHLCGVPPVGSKKRRSPPPTPTTAHHVPPPNSSIVGRRHQLFDVAAAPGKLLD